MEVREDEKTIDKTTEIIIDSLLAWNQELIGKVTIKVKSGIIFLVIIRSFQISSSMEN